MIVSGRSPVFAYPSPSLLLCDIFLDVHARLEPINIFHGHMKTDNEPIRISYHRNVHYNSVVHPYKATIGVGLGLPALCPGLADRNLMQDATRVSERSHIEQTMFEDKIKVPTLRSHDLMK